MREPQEGSFSWPASYMRDDAFLMPRGSDGRHPRTPTQVIASIPSPPRTVFTCRITFPASFYRMDLKIYNMCYYQPRQNGSQVTVYQSKYTVLFPVAHSWEADTSGVCIIFRQLENQTFCSNLYTIYKPKYKIDNFLRNIAVFILNDLSIHYIYIIHVPSQILGSRVGTSKGLFFCLDCHIT